MMKAGVQMSGWREVPCPTKADWRSVSVESGERSVMITSTTLMLGLSATVWDSGWY